MNSERKEITNIPVHLSPEIGTGDAKEERGNCTPDNGPMKQEDKNRHGQKEGSGTRKRCREDNTERVKRTLYFNGRVIGSGRSGCVLSLSDRQGHLYAAKSISGLDEERSDEEYDILCELQNEVKIYKKLRGLQGKVVPKFHYSGYLHGCEYTLLLDELDAYPLWKCDLSYEEKETIVWALGEIHAAGVLHGDIREQNILLHRTTKQPYFIDFGFSRESSCEMDFEEEIKKLRALLDM
ncbi:probable serine/threonine-protein kinase DDB_G0281745 [Centruroides sculpturatus]|uniref:probable serine/threonine-protein kinase DDB_G0281745 n=1 Tax=Centruroides sculpturatus TaxID=218467 RepID=UPI000C6E49A2|nr:probable serine/threonine-protein kinase DDB_G0281745 [Centruroides sculpturatus]